MIKYQELCGTDKPLNRVVIAGSHDAGITEGSRNAKTQTSNLGAQAAAGARFFDIRVTAKADGMHGGTKQVKMVTFHADDKVKKSEPKLRFSADLQRMETMERTKLPYGGTFGMEFQDVLGQARAFVESPDGQGEFLMLKFSKSDNFPLVAAACRGVLGGQNSVLLTGRPVINRMTLGQLAGKVVVLFPQSAKATVENSHQNTDGFHYYQNLYNKDDHEAGVGAYDGEYEGLQFWGKGGTNVWNAHKITENVDKHKMLWSLSKELNVPGDVMRMMYWTTTGTVTSIKKRDRAMWDTPNRIRFKQVWDGGVGEEVDNFIPLPMHLRDGGMEYMRAARAVFPNIVMVDFVDSLKCGIVASLNLVTPSQLREMNLANQNQ